MNPTIVYRVLSPPSAFEMEIVTWNTIYFERREGKGRIKFYSGWFSAIFED